MADAGGERAARSTCSARTQPDSMLDVFDVPQGGNNCTRRNASTIALQSLSLLNSEFVTARAAAMAARLQRSAGDDGAAKIASVSARLSRPPTAEEAAAAAQFIDTQPKNYPDQPDAAPHHGATFAKCYWPAASFCTSNKRIHHGATEMGEGRISSFVIAALRASSPLVCCQRYQKRVC